MAIGPMDETAAIRWVEADVPLPSEATIEGEVSDGD